MSKEDMVGSGGGLTPGESLPEGHSTPAHENPVPDKGQAAVMETPTPTTMASHTFSIKENGGGDAVIVANDGSLTVVRTSSEQLPSPQLAASVVSPAGLATTEHNSASQQPELHPAPNYSLPTPVQPNRVVAAVPQPMAAPEGSTVVGMVGNTPIVRLPETRQVIKEIKGRFVVLEDVPIFTQSDVAPVPEAAPPNHHERNLSNLSGALNLSNPSTSTTTVNGNNNNIPQTFDGTGAPVVKKKGRFYVTNLKDPGLISVSVNPPQQMGPGGVPDSAAPTSQNDTNSPPQPFGQPYQTVVVTAAGTLPAGVPQHVTYTPRTASQSISSTHTVWSEQIATTAVTPPTLVVAPLTPPGEISTPPPPPPPPPAITLHPPVQQQPPLPASLPAEATRSELSQTTTSRRPATMARSPAASSGIAGQTGLGKVFYFLDQMKLEVTEADRTIKSLQMDMKFLVRVVYVLRMNDQIRYIHIYSFWACLMYLSFSD
jgi:hypothetical protein